MSIIRMRSSTKRLLLLGLVGVLAMLSLISLRTTPPSSQPTISEPTGLRFLLEEKVGTTALARRATASKSRNALTQVSTLSSTFTIDSALFNLSHSGAQHYLSGSITTDVQATVVADRTTALLSGTTLVSIEGIREPLSGDVSSTALQGFTSKIVWHAQKSAQDWYITLDEITFTSPSLTGLTTFRQRYLLLKTYEDTWIRVDEKQLTWIHPLLPGYLVDQLEENDQKTRIVPGSQDTWIFLLSGTTMSISGTITQLQQIESLIIDLPLFALKVHYQGSSHPEIGTLRVEQTNAYRGHAEGTLEITASKRGITSLFEGTALWPKGITATINYSSHQKKGVGFEQNNTPPQQFIDRKTIADKRRLTNTGASEQLGSAEEE